MALGAAAATAGASPPAARAADTPASPPDPCSAAAASLQQTAPRQDRLRALPAHGMNGTEVLGGTLLQLQESTCLRSRTFTSERQATLAKSRDKLLLNAMFTASSTSTRAATSSEEAHMVMCFHRFFICASTQELYCAKQNVIRGGPLSSD